MKYNPEKHHRRSIRLKGYDYTSAGAYFITICTHQRECFLGEIVEGEMQLNESGQIVRSHWLKLPHYYPHLQLDAFVVMPNHFHGILVLIDRTVGAGLADQISAKPVEPTTKPALTADQISAKPVEPTTKPALTADQISVKPIKLTTEPAPTEASVPNNHHGIPEIIRGFKTFSARRINQKRNMQGSPVWQRNYYEHIIRSEESLHRIRQYIHQNPRSWQQDQLHLDNSLKR